MAKQISLSFKEHEMEMYNFIKSKSSPSIYIKELIKNTMNGENKQQNNDKHENPKSANSMSLSSLNIGK